MRCGVGPIHQIFFAGIYVKCQGIHRRLILVNLLSMGWQVKWDQFSKTFLWEIPLNVHICTESPFLPNSSPWVGANLLKEYFAKHHMKCPNVHSKLIFVNPHPCIKLGINSVMFVLQRVAWTVCVCTENSFLPTTAPCMEGRGQFSKN